MTAREWKNGMNRRHFLWSALGWSALLNRRVAAAASLGCTPSPIIPVPLVEGDWRSGEFPVGRHGYNVELHVDRTMPSEQLDCDLGPPREGHECSSSPLLDLEWRIWDGTMPVKNRAASPIRADAWSDRCTSCMLGGFEGRKNGRFILELHVKRDGGRLKDLHPRVQIVKNPGYWCWL